jgi:hypothetical protein
LVSSTEEVADMTNNGRRSEGHGYVQAWIEGILSLLGSTRSPGRNGKWQCPVHGRTGEHATSLAVGTRDDGGAWVHCHAGCTTREIAAALGLTLDQLRTPPRLSPPRWVACRRLRTGFPAPKAGGSPRSEGYRHEAFHQYGPDFCLERLRHPVTGDKAMEWEARNPKGEWVPGLLGTPERELPLYREYEVRAAVALGETVLLVESESSVDALNRAGWYATTWAGGAGAPPLERIATRLAGHRHLVIVGDADEAGRRCVRRLGEVLPHARLLISEREGEDARDLHTRLGAGAFTELVAAAHDRQSCAA